MVVYLKLVHKLNINTARSRSLGDKEKFSEFIRSRNPQIPSKAENCQKVKNDDGNLDGKRNVKEIQREIKYLWQDICLITQYQLNSSFSVSATQIPCIFQLNLIFNLIFEIWNHYYSTVFDSFLFPAGL